jgi:hypothetical protein
VRPSALKSRDLVALLSDVRVNEVFMMYSSVRTDARAEVRGAGSGHPFLTAWWVSLRKIRSALCFCVSDMLL